MGEKNAYIAMLETRIETLNADIHLATERRDALLAELKDTQQQVFETETGLHYGAELEVTDEFVRFENARSNDGSIWKFYVEKYGEPLRLYKDSVEYFRYNDLRVGHGGTSVGGLPVDLVQRMRNAWLLKHKPDEPPDSWRNNPKARPMKHPGSP